MNKNETDKPTLVQLQDKQTVIDQQWSGRFFDPADISSDGIEEDGTLNESYAKFWSGE